MVVFSNHRIGPGAELLVSREVAAALLQEVAAAAGPRAQARWEHELVDWLARCAIAQAGLERSRVSGGGVDERIRVVGGGIDVADIAWTPDNFERQRGFLIDAIRHAMETSANARALARWAAMIEAHPRESVQVGRRWQWPVTELTARNI